MRPTVKIAFDLSLAGAGEFFTLDDPVKGELDNTDFLLAGDILTDVSDDVRSVEFRRGRSAETSNVDAGNGTIVLDNRLRKYDPLAPASVTPLAPSILPRKEVIVDIGGGRQFSGIVEDWDLEYAKGGDSVTLVRLTDGLTLLSERSLASGAGATGLSSSVIASAAAAVDWPPARFDLDEGTATVGVHSLDSVTPVLPYMQKITNTESGLLFINKNGNLAFRDRVSPRRVMGALFADDGTGIPFDNVQISFGTELLYTQVEIDYPSGSVTLTETFQAASGAVADYGVRNLKVDTFLPDATSASAIGEALIDRYGHPELRIEAIDVELDHLSPAQQAQVLDLDLGDGVEISFTPNGIGDAIFREMAVDQIKHTIVPNRHTVQFRLFVPVLLTRDGSASGTSSISGSVAGGPGMFGEASGSSSASGTVTGVFGALGSVTGSVGTSGSVTGVSLSAFVLDTSELDGADVLSA